MANTSDPVTITYSSTNLMSKLLEYRDNKDDKTGFLHHIATRKVLFQIGSPILYAMQTVETIAFAVLAFLLSPLFTFDKTENFYCENFLNSLVSKLVIVNLTLQTIFTNLFRKNINSEEHREPQGLTISLVNKIEEYSSNSNNNRCGRELAQRFGGLANLVTSIVEGTLLSIASIVVAPFTPLHKKIANAHTNIIGHRLSMSLGITSLTPGFMFGKLVTAPPSPATATA